MNQPLKQCRTAGCTTLIPADGPAYCAQHARKARIDQWEAADARRKDTPELAIAAKLRSSPAWQRLRAAHISAHPWCFDPFKVHGKQLALARHVHHVQPVAAHPELALEGDNLRSLCIRCHARVEARERAGEATQHLFTCESVKPFDAGNSCLPTGDGQKSTA